MRISGLKYAVIGSGSSGNSYIFQYGDLAFIVDNGFSCKQAIERASSMGFDLSLVKYIFLTHDHSDHFRGVELLSRRLKAEVVVHRDLDLRCKVKKHLYSRRDIVPGEEYAEGDFRFAAFNTSHDAPFSLSYSFMLGGNRFTIITDTGVVNGDMLSYAADSDVLFLEANYCPDMLESGPYPHYLKERIRSNCGHLSNNDAVDFLNSIAGKKGSRLDEVYFCHLSDVNNSPEVLAEYAEKHLRWRGRWMVCRKGCMQHQMDHQEAVIEINCESGVD